MPRRLAYGLLLLLLAAASSGGNPIEDGWRELERGAKNFMKTLSRQFATPAIRNLYRMNISADCVNSLIRISQGMLSLQRWALHYLDATGKLPEGALGGSYTNLGSYDLCRNLETTVKGKVLFRGQYCSIRIHPPMPPEPKDFHQYPAFVPLPELANFTSSCNNVVCDIARIAQASYFTQPTFGICIPDACPAEDVQKVMDGVKNFFNMKPLNIEVNSCKTASFSEPWNHWQIIVTSLLAVMATFLVLCTLIDLVLPFFWPACIEKKNRKPLKFIKCFSVYANTKELLRTDNLSHPKLKFLHGIRVLSFCWVALGHCYIVFGGIIPLRNMLKGYDFLANPFFQAVYNAILSVDTFFFMSGFLLTYLHSSKMKLVEYPQLFIKSYLKLMIPTGFVLLFTHVMPLMIDNPNVDRVNLLISSCAKHWWKVIFMIGNLLPISVKETCLFQLWFIMVQVQLFIPGIFVLAVMHRFRKQAIPLLGSIILLGAISSLLLSTIAHFDPSPPIDSYNVVYWFKIFANPVLHISPFGTGMLMGHLLIEGYFSKLGVFQCSVGWVVCTACAMFSVYAPYLWVGELLPVDQVWNAKMLYALFNRLAWSAALAWITLTCFYDRGGLVQEFLSWQGFLPLGRLSFAAFFTHAQVFHLIAGNLTVEMEVCHTLMICLFFATLFINFGYAYIFQMAILFPIERLLRLRTPPRQDPPTPETERQPKTQLQVQLKSCKYLVSNH